MGGRTDVDAVVIPVCTRHVLVDVGIDPRHFERWDVDARDVPSVKRSVMGRIAVGVRGGKPPLVVSLEVWSAAQPGNPKWEGYRYLLKLASRHSVAIQG